MPRECGGVSKWAPSFPGAAQARTGNPFLPVFSGAMDPLTCSCTSKLATSSHPGMKTSCLTSRSGVDCARPHQCEAGWCRPSSPGGFVGHASPYDPGGRATRSGQVKRGAQGRDRTTDTAIFSRMLYQLSYLGVPPWPEKAERERRFIVRQGGSVHHASPLGLRVAQRRARPRAKRARRNPEGEGERLPKIH
jgi:hypothetical protein